MKARKKRAEPTELESCVLGAIWLRGPCSAYAIRREFAQSTSSFWSASSGSIYPVIKRLKALKLVSAVSDPSDGRGTHDLVATASGVRVLRSWVRDLPDWTGKPGLDPVRARMNFLAVLETRADRLDFVRRAEIAAHAQAKLLKGAGRKLKETSRVEYLTNLGSLLEIEARARWLKAVRKALAGPPP